MFKLISAFLLFSSIPAFAEFKVVIQMKDAPTYFDRVLTFQNKYSGRSSPISWQKQKDSEFYELNLKFADLDEKPFGIVLLSSGKKVAESKSLFIWSKTIDPKQEKNIVISGDKFTGFSNFKATRSNGSAWNDLSGNHDIVLCVSSPFRGDSTEKFSSYPSDFSIFAHEQQNSSSAQIKGIFVDEFTELFNINFTLNKIPKDLEIGNQGYIDIPVNQTVVPQGNYQLLRLFSVRSPDSDINDTDDEDHEFFAKTSEKIRVLLGGRALSYRLNLIATAFQQPIPCSSESSQVCFFNLLRDSLVSASVLIDGAKNNVYILPLERISELKIAKELKKGLFDKEGPFLLSSNLYLRGEKDPVQNLNFNFIGGINTEGCISYFEKLFNVYFEFFNVDANAWDSKALKFNDLEPTYSIDDKQNGLYRYTTKYSFGVQLATSSTSFDINYKSKDILVKPNIVESVFIGESEKSKLLMFDLIKGKSDADQITARIRALNSATWKDLTPSFYKSNLKVGTFDITDIVDNKKLYEIEILVKSGGQRQNFTRMTGIKVQ